MRSITKSTPKLQLDLLTKLTAIAQRASRWMLRARTANADLPTLIQRYQPGARELRANLQSMVTSSGLRQFAKKPAKFSERRRRRSRPRRKLSGFEFIFPALDLVDLAQSTGSELKPQHAPSFGIDAELSLTGWRDQINRLPTDTLWQTQARGSACDDVYSIASQVTRSLLSRKESITAWRTQHEQAIAKLNQLLTTITTQGADLAPVSVALRELRGLG